MDVSVSMGLCGPNNLKNSVLWYSNHVKCSVKKKTKKLETV